MKKNIKDLFDNFNDETVNIAPTIDISPDKILEMTKHKIKEDTNMNITKHKRKLSFPIIAAATVTILSIGVFAAHTLISSKEIAKHLENYKLAEYFSSDDTKFNLEPQTSGDYSFQILGIASGKNLSSFTEVNADKSYIVGAISKVDKTPITDYPEIMITPLFAGYKPWQVNAFTLNGGKQDFIYDGIDYFIFECDNIEIFADNTIYIAAYEGMAPSSQIFTVNNDETIQFNKDYKGTQALFTLPIDKSKANPEKVKELLNNDSSNDLDNNETPIDDIDSSKIVFEEIPEN